ncbi:xanthine dehydrogenase family protein molybdopterin-binding subunit [Pseudonocardia kujensis]|uniref:xanthine dehydrogenase family protein molybdopterin-binding subunit n=1 Tax=Pseudonocardia kujensis TaxID=1128675 RepID=UPI001E2E2FC2|nr:xanthine dehydrogenase family protein molybdopterin-binding subunit [Pseudonocardia kujensis]MCE0767600.1 xanthine dehydrogenase family protein molybdopterin-binding subunit [Pseudonocardia kujensis]
MTVDNDRSIVGAPLPRVEGPAKVTGAAKYSADNELPGMLHAAIVGAPVARGRLVQIDTTALAAVEGVVRVLTREDMPTFGAVHAFQAAALDLPMQSDEIHFEGEPVAIVLGTSLQAVEQARPLVRVRCAAQPPILPGHGEREVIAGEEGERDGGSVGEEGGMTWMVWPYGGPVRIGDAAASLETSHTRVGGTWTHPSRHHNPMETSSTIAHWDGDVLTMWDSVQASFVVPPVLADALGIDPGNVTVVSPHTGGGFGAKGWVWPHQVLTAAAARIVGRPVKLHLTRADQYTSTGFQPALTQHLELGADSSGRLTATRHHVSNITGLTETYVEGATEVKDLYACPALDTGQDVERISVGAPTPMRTTNEGCGLWALESAMNELAHELNIDPLELRLRNYADREPTTERPWSSKRLREAYADGARLFGWYDRPRDGRTDGPWRIGTGMATCTMGQVRFPGNARVRLARDGSVRIETDIQDIGTGLQTVLTQIAADELDVPVGDVSVAWGHSDLPSTGPVYASSATVHTGSAVALACRELRKNLSEYSDTPSVTDAIAETDLAEIVGEGKFGLEGNAPIDVGGGDSGYAIRSFGAVFVEVAVDPELGLLRLRRMVGSYSCGRIMNERTARAQMIGSLTWAWGKATMERSELDPATARWLSKNLTGVHVPANADIPADIIVHFVDEVDPHASAIGARGVGEVGATGVDAAIADAVFDAVGVRIRDLPITPKRLLTAIGET